MTEKIKLEKGNSFKFYQKLLLAVLTSIITGNSFKIASADDSSKLNKDNNIQTIQSNTVSDNQSKKENIFDDFKFNERLIESAEKIEKLGIKLTIRINPQTYEISIYPKIPDDLINTKTRDNLFSGSEQFLKENRENLINLENNTEIETNNRSKILIEKITDPLFAKVYQELEQNFDFEEIKKNIVYFTDNEGESIGSGFSLSELPNSNISFTNHHVSDNWQKIPVTGVNKVVDNNFSTRIESSYNNFKSISGINDVSLLINRNNQDVENAKIAIENLLNNQTEYQIPKNNEEFQQILLNEYNKGDYVYGGAVTTRDNQELNETHSNGRNFLQLFGIILTPVIETSNYGEKLQGQRFLAITPVRNFVNKDNEMEIDKNMVPGTSGSFVKIIISDKIYLGLVSTAVNEITDNTNILKFLFPNSKIDYNSVTQHLQKYQTIGITILTKDDLNKILNNLEQLPKYPVNSQNSGEYNKFFEPKTSTEYSNLEDYYLVKIADFKRRIDFNEFILNKENKNINEILQLLKIRHNILSFTRDMQDLQIEENTIKEIIDKLLSRYSLTEKDEIIIKDYFENKNYSQYIIESSLPIFDIIIFDYSNLSSVNPNSKIITKEEIEKISERMKKYSQDFDFLCSEFEKYLLENKNEINKEDAIENISFKFFDDEKQRLIDVINKIIP